MRHWTDSVFVRKLSCSYYYCSSPNGRGFLIPEYFLKILLCHLVPSGAFCLRAVKHQFNKLIVVDSFVFTYLGLLIICTKSHWYEVGNCSVLVCTTHMLHKTALPIPNRTVMSYSVQGVFYAPDT